MTTVPMTNQPLSRTRAGEFLGEEGFDGLPFDGGKRFDRLDGQVAFLGLEVEFVVSIAAAYLVAVKGNGVEQAVNGAAPE